jgi:hypothetical protein
MNYHLVKRNEELNGNVGKKQKEGKHWLIQTSLSKKPAGSKAEINDIVYIYEVGYGVWAKAQITKIEEIVEFNTVRDVISFALNDAKYKINSYWGQEILSKLGDKVDDNFKYFVLQIEVNQEFLDNVVTLDNEIPIFKSQSSWVTLDHPIDFYSYSSEELSPIIPPKLRTQIQLRFNAISKDFIYDVDHFVPRSVGGPGNIEENLIPLSLSVNRWKSNRIPSGLFFIACGFLEVNKVKSPYLSKTICSHDLYFNENDAFKDAALIVSIINSLHMDRVRDFYKAVRAYHFPNY